MSIVCNECGTVNEDNAQFCVGCGAVLTPQNSQPQQGYQKPQPQPQPVYQKPAYEKPSQQQKAVKTNKTNIQLPRGNGLFVDASEVTVATLTNGMVLNFISGEGLRKEDAILTDKRMYYNHTDGLINLRTTEEKVNLRDITGTKIHDWNPRGILIIAALFILIGLYCVVEGMGGGFFFGLLMALVFGVVYLILKKKFLRIEYAGGHIDFSVKKYSMANIREFQRCIHAMKDTM